MAINQIFDVTIFSEGKLFKKFTKEKFLVEDRSQDYPFVEVIIPKKIDFKDLLRKTIKNDLLVSLLMETL